MGRKQAVDFNHTTLETFKRIIPPEIYEIKKQEKEIILWNTAKIWYGGLDDTERVNKFNSAELAFIAIDQAEETERTEIEILQASLRLKHNGKYPPFKQLYTANPSDCWLKEDFIDNKLPGKFYIPAFPGDNPHLPENYIAHLRDVFRYNKALLLAYLEGNWFALQSENALISTQMLDALKTAHYYPPCLKRIISCDPSLGGDECVIDFIENNTLKEQFILINERDTMKIAGQIVVLAEKTKTPNYAIDIIGIGQGVADRIKELKPEANVQYINSAEESKNSERFSNCRAEMWWYTMEEIQEKHVAYPKDEELRRQLIAMRFKVINSNGKIQLELKEKTKKRIGRSPDRADAFVYGIYGLSQTEPIKQKDGWASEGKSREVSVAVASAMTA